MQVGAQVSSFPGLAALTRVDNFYLVSTEMSDFTSFRGLSCTSSITVGGQAWQSLRSFAGLGNVQVTPGSIGPDTPELRLMSWPDMYPQEVPMTAAGLAPPRLFAACRLNNTSPWTTGFISDPVCASGVRPTSCLERGGMLWTVHV